MVLLCDACGDAWIVSAGLECGRHLDNHDCPKPPPRPWPDAA